MSSEAVDLLQATIRNTCVNTGNQIATKNTTPNTVAQRLDRAVSAGLGVSRAAVSNACNRPRDLGGSPPGSDRLVDVGVVGQSVVGYSGERSR